MRLAVVVLLDPQPPSAGALLAALAAATRPGDEVIAVGGKPQSAKGRVVLDHLRTQSGTGGVRWCSLSTQLDLRAFPGVGVNAGLSLCTTDACTVIDGGQMPLRAGLDAARGRMRDTGAVIVAAGVPARAGTRLDALSATGGVLMRRGLARAAETQAGLVLPFLAIDAMLRADRLETIPEPLVGRIAACLDPAQLGDLAGGVAHLLAERQPDAATLQAILAALRADLRQRIECLDRDDLWPVLTALRAVAGQAPFAAFVADRGENRPPTPLSPVTDTPLWQAALWLEGAILDRTGGLAGDAAETRARSRWRALRGA